MFFFLVPRIFTNLENFRKSGSDQVFESQKCIEIEKHVGVYITFIRIVIKKLNFLYQIFFFFYRKKVSKLWAKLNI